MMISIIMPTYQNAEFIGRAIDSVMTQSYQDFELIIIDNFSIDETENIVMSYRDSRIIYKKFKNHGIISKSRNEAIRIAKGDMFAFLDSDDWWHKDKLKLCLMNSTDLDLIYHKVRIVKKNFRLNLFTFGRQPTLKNLNESLYKFGNFIPNSSVVISRRIFEKVGMISENPNKVTWEDFDYWIKLSSASNSYKFVDKILGYYWLGNTNNTTPYKTRENILNMQKIIFQNTKTPIWLEYQDAISLHKIGEEKDSIYKLQSIINRKNSNLLIKVKAALRFFQFSLLTFFSKK